MNRLNSQARAAMLAACMLGTSQLATPLLAQGATENLVKNGSFETDEDGNNAPDGWPGAKDGITWETEAGNRFLRLTSQEPHKMLLTYSEIRIPAGTRAVELKFRQRVSNLKRGKQSWFDARIMMNWLDNDRKKLNPGPPAPATPKDTDGWQEKSVKFLVAEGATMLALMPTLFNVETGTFDLDDISLTPVDAEALEAEAKAKAAAREEAAGKAAAKRDESILKNMGPDGNLVANGDFQKDTDGDGTPDKWGKPNAEKGITYGMEGDNRFLKLNSPEAFKMVLYYQVAMLPSTAKAVEISWKQRISNLKPGNQNFHDARIMSDFVNASFGKMAGGPILGSSRSNTDGWVAKSKSVLVAPGAAGIAIMPTLFQVETGTFEIDDLVVKAIDAQPLIDEAAKKAAEKKAAAP